MQVEIDFEAPLTAQQIVQRAEDQELDERRELIEINRMFREQDDSDKWPINRRFNATERAIKRVRESFRQSGMVCRGLEYALALESEVSRIVNDAT